MSNPWNKLPTPADAQNLSLSEIISEQYASGLQIQEDSKFAEMISNQHIPSSSEDITPEILQQIQDSSLGEYCDSDAIIAKVLQCQFDKEHDDEIKRVEKKRNGDSKVSVSYDNYRNVPGELLYDSEPEDEDVEVAAKKDWDRFEANEKEYASLPKRGFIMKEGERVTKHDNVINGRRNACRMMAFPPEVQTGDGAGFDMKLPNTVFNHLKEQTRQHQSRRVKVLDRKESHATAELGLDEQTRLILYKLINGGMLEEINGIISTGKESIVLHANSDPNFPDAILPKECAIKVYKTTSNEFKGREKYIKNDYRFKDRFSKQNPRKMIYMWAEKEMHNLMRMQKLGLNCPDIICLKKHILVMSFIGKDSKPAPKLKDVILSPEKWRSVYKEVVDIVYKLYNEGHMIHADLSEYNILWWENKCWFIDVSQAVQPNHPGGLEFLLRDCRNIYNFFEKKGVPGVKTAEELFQSITGYEAADINLPGVHVTYNADLSRFEIGPDDNRNDKYPFEFCWQNNKASRIIPNKVDSDDGSEGDQSESDTFDEMWIQSQKAKAVVDTASNFGNETNLAPEPLVVDKAVNFGNAIDVAPQDEASSSSTDKEKKS